VKFVQFVAKKNTKEFPMGYKTDWFRGIYPALVTPFTRDDRLDEEAYRRLIRYVLPHVNGVVPCGTTGEFSYMTLEERQRAIEVCLDEVNGRVPVLAGTGCPSTRETFQLTRWARDAGVTGVLVVAPYYLKPTFNEVYDHFRALGLSGRSHRHLQHPSVRRDPLPLVDGGGDAPGPGERG
jgi:dihydrodipicolinate synthase/N-acetylneuraminate lyase